MNGFKEVLQDKLLLRASFLSFIIIIISLLSIIFYYQNLPPFIPLFNQMPWGEQRIAKTIWIFIIPGVSILFFIVNLIFAKYVYKAAPLVARLFSFATFLISVLSFIFILRTIYVAL